MIFAVLSRDMLGAIGETGKRDLKIKLNPQSSGDLITCKVFGIDNGVRSCKVVFPK